ncbi:IQ domain-containing protein IQM3 [Glycine soja]|uniref:IQ domain-containing protein IQM3 n=1 Tax=Glycine soja TaxID=3848 RepID=A0A445LE80_GLYSO|nr:IQ domain-containing protein IQM3 [Glycine soja]
MEVETHSLSPTFELIHLLSQSTTDTYFPPNNAANQPSLGHATAVLKLQKVYRTRLAGWPTPPLLPRRWQAIDYVRLNHSTISFFNLPETAASCWSRVKLNAAKVGKGLSKDAIAQKCWLSSIGSKLLIHDIAMDITYNTTIKNGVKQMLVSRFFFYWLDLGNRKNLLIMNNALDQSFKNNALSIWDLGHYRPTDDTLDSFLSYLKENGVKLDEVELHKANEDSDIYEESNVIEKQQPLKCQALVKCGLQSPRAVVPKTAILQRINSKKASKSYQLGHQLSLKWSTGAGPRIGCVADYPIELRTQAYPFFIHANGRPCIAFSLSIL